MGGATSRTPFIFLVVGLLGGGLLSLLLINTVLGAGAYRISDLQRGNILLAQREQQLQAQIAREESPSVLAQRARGLGMADPGLLHFVNLRTGQVMSQPAHVAGVPAVPGYTP